MTMVGETPVASASIESRGASAKLFDVISTIASLALRFALAIPFFRSGLTKWNGFLEISPGALFLFESEYKLNVFGAAYSFPYPYYTAHLAAIGEVVLPVLLVLGLATRFAALGLLVMAGVIFLVYPHTWATEQLPWSAMALALIAFGAGKISLDYLIARRMGRT
jgi:putative oxidoreductase